MRERIEQVHLKVEGDEGRWVQDSLLHEKRQDLGRKTPKQPIPNLPRILGSNHGLEGTVTGPEETIWNEITSALLVTSGDHRPEVMLTSGSQENNKASAHIQGGCEGQVA